MCSQSPSPGDFGLNPWHSPSRSEVRSDWAYHGPPKEWRVCWNTILGDFQAGYNMFGGSCYTCHMLSRKTLKSQNHFHWRFHPRTLCLTTFNQQHDSTSSQQRGTAYPAQSAQATLCSSGVASMSSSRRELRRWIPTYPSHNVWYTPE